MNCLHCEAETTKEMREPQCGVCHRRTRVFYSRGIAGQKAEPFITAKTSPCAYCAETERLRGWKEAIGYLIEARER